MSNHEASAPLTDWRDAELDALRALLREALDALPTVSAYGSRVEYLKDLRSRIDAALK
jgi:hypothetical protein